jgi:c-di-GMP-binding flagellar brake protein YcgR
MKENRQYKRFTLDVMEVNGTMLRAADVKIIDISLGGISIKVDRRLNIGTDYLLKLSDRNEVMSLKGSVIWSLLVESKKAEGGNRIPIYQAGLAFSGLTEKDTPSLDDFIERNKVDKSPLPKGRRSTGRFRIETQEKARLQFPENFKVRQISLGGMLIESDHKMEINGRVPMELFSDGSRPIRFFGRVVFCRALGRNSPTLYSAGIEFPDLNEKDKKVLDSFIKDCEAQDLQGCTGKDETPGISLL